MKQEPEYYVRTTVELGCKNVPDTLYLAEQLRELLEGRYLSIEGYQRVEDFADALDLRARESAVKQDLEEAVSGTANSPSAR